MNVPSSAEVIRIDASNTILSLPQVLQLGAMTVHRREYSAVEIESADGFIGKSYCLSREAPMVEIIDRLVRPHVIGGNSSEVAEVWHRAIRGSAIVGRIGLVRRAIGLVDIALYDIAAQRQGVPLWKHLGTGNKPRPALIASAYPTRGRSASYVAAEVLSHAKLGWKTLKIARSPDNKLMRDVFSILSSELDPGCETVVDVGFAWPDADTALADIDAWGQPNLAWLEDPLLPEDVSGCAKVRKESGLPIGVGDEVTDPTLFDHLIEANAIDVARVDVVAIGGITPALELIPRLRGHGLRVSSHVSPEASVHLGVEVETFDRSPHGNPYDPSPLLIEGGPDFVSGYATPPTTTGLGFDFKSRHFSFEENQ